MTLLDLVSAVCDVTDDDREVVAIVGSLLHSHRVRFRNARAIGEVALFAAPFPAVH